MPLRHNITHNCQQSFQLTMTNASCDSPLVLDHDTTRYGEAEEDPERRNSLGVVMRNWVSGVASPPHAAMVARRRVSPFNGGCREARGGVLTSRGRSDRRTRLRNFAVRRGPAGARGDRLSSGLDTVPALGTRGLVRSGAPAKQRFDQRAAVPACERLRPSAFTRHPAPQHDLIRYCASNECDKKPQFLRQGRSCT